MRGEAERGPTGSVGHEAASGLGIAASALALGVVGGFLVGAVRAFYVISLNHYVAYRMDRLILDALAAELRRGLIGGALVGCAAAATAVLLAQIDRRRDARSPLPGEGATRVSGHRPVRRPADLLARVASVAIAGAVALGVTAGLVEIFRLTAEPGSRRLYAILMFAITLLIVLGNILLAVFRRHGRRLVRLRPAIVTLGSTVALTLLVQTTSWIVAHRAPVGPSILLLTVDTLRADHLGCYGYARDTSPRLDELARTGRLYENAYAHAPVTPSSFASILSGVRPRETDTYGMDPLRPAINTITEQLRNAGYETGAIVSNFVLARGRHFEDGFQQYDDRMDEYEAVRRVPERTGEATTEAAIAWLRRHRDRPFFCWVHYQDPHGPYTPPRELQPLFLDGADQGPTLRVNDTISGRRGIPSYQVLDDHRRAGYYVSQYDAEIRYVDQCIAELVSEMRSLDLWDRTLVVFTSDHGESMGRHDDYFTHGDDLFPGVLHVPLILWGPQPWINPGRSSTVVQSIDLAPTMLAVAGVEPQLRLPGRNLRADVPDAMVVSETFHEENYKCSVSDGVVQLVWDRFNDDYLVYDLGADTLLAFPRERLGARFVALETFLERHRNPRARSLKPHRGFGADEIEMLRSLGYAN
ncbi:MAG: sulfatase-like hydrolase/transferase [Candidatus Eisenbacteria bacterium]|uniref:Sulfatase-like hydrolase/transferase n=1 Tax=Eiseniibacteriota bacterium TaxID=2212470 RepID=A0A956LYC5_UNCEI|nr:sulfatase-like hydrolase/transferase [Candidatus Eisenbacteria bacterium]